MIEINTSDVCFLCVCKVQHGALETMERRDVIGLSHINCPGMTERLYLCVFTLGACYVPDGTRDKGKEERPHGEIDRGSGHNTTLVLDQAKYAAYRLH